MKQTNSLRSFKATWPFLLAAFAAAAWLDSAYAGPGTNFVDDFESGLGNWTQVSTTYTNLIWSSSQNKVPAGSGHSAYSLNTAQRMYASSLVPGGLGITSASCKFSYWLYDGSNTHTYAEIRNHTTGYYDPGSSTIKQLIAIGKFNSVSMTGETYDGTKYQGRFANGSSSGWFNLNAPGAPSRSTGWHKFEVERGTDWLGQNVYIFYVDSKVGRVLTNNSDGFTAWNAVVMGAGISSSAGGGDSYFDGFQVLSGQSFILQDPPNTVATLGNSADLTVDATGDADGPYYQWYKGSTALSGKTDATLHFDTLAYSDAGSYSVVVSNILSVKTSAVAVLTVNAPLFATVAPTAVVANPGSNVIFTATANGQEPITYQWNKNGSPMSGRTDSTLTLSSVSSADAASYTVTVHNGIDPDNTSGLAVLTLNAAPTIAPIGTVSANVGTTAYIPVSATDDLSGSGLFGDFETNALGATALFQAPHYSGTTAAYVDGPNSFACVTNAFPPGNPRAGTHAYYITCNFTNAATPGWVRLTTTSFNPTIMFTTPFKFDIYTSRRMGVAVGMREVSPSPTGAIGSNAGTSSGPIEFVGDTTAGTPPVPLFTTYTGVWTNLTYDLSDATFTNTYIKTSGMVTGNNGYLDTTTGKGVLEDLALTPCDGLGLYTIYLDNIQSVPADAIRYSLDAAPEGATIDRYTGVITFTPPSTGTFSFTVRATDGLNLPGVQTFSVNAQTAISPVANVTVAVVGSDLKITYGGGSASHFVLLGSSSLTAPMNTWSVIATTNNTTPATFTLPLATAQGAKMFYRIQSQ